MRRYKKLSEMSAVELENMSEEEIKKMKRREASRKSIEKRKSLPKYNIPAGGLTTVPADYSSGKFKPLEKEDFATEADYLDFIADKMERMAKRKREEAKVARSFGNVKDVKKMKKVTKLLAEFADMKGTEDAVNIKALMMEWLNKQAD
jgi:hypothetical protein